MILKRILKLNLSANRLEALHPVLPKGMLFQYVLKGKNLKVCRMSYKTNLSQETRYHSLEKKMEKDNDNSVESHLPSRKFQRRIENFTCDHCGTEVVGNGYTNHCPSCLYSKHVDINPGDRREACQGMMKPIELTTKKGDPAILHQCLSCGLIRKNKASKQDNLDPSIFSPQLPHRNR